MSCKPQFSILTAVCLLCCSIYSAVAAPMADQIETDLWKVQFALLQSTDLLDLETESWSNSLEVRDVALSELAVLEEEKANQISKTERPDDLLALLAPLTQNGQFEVIATTKWVQPSSQKRHTAKIFQPVSTLGEYDLLYGSVKLEERASLVAQVSLTLVDQDTLALPEVDQSQDIAAFDEMTSSTSVETNSADVATLDMPPSQAIEVETTSSNALPILFIRQQRQMKLNQLHYFDHPITPGFLLVTKNEARK